VKIDALLTGPLLPGQWVLTFLGAARERVDAAEAKRIGDAVTALETLLAGGSVDLDACFADLIDREPQLPPHLQQLVEKEER
jgi:hydrogenase expression/formation protein HypC